MKYGLLVLCILAALLIAPAAMAQSIETGNHYSGIDIWQENNSQYGPPPVDPIEVASKTSGSLYIFLRSAGCLDEQSRQISIAYMDGTNVLHEMIGADGHFDIRLPVGKYFVVLPKGTGSSYDDNTWKQETADVTIAAGGRTDVAFIGAGSSCGDTPVACILKINSATYGMMECHEVIDVPAHTEYRIHYRVFSWSSVEHTTWTDAYQNPSAHPYHHYHTALSESREIAAVTHEVCTGTYADVTSNVQSVVNSGRNQFLFDNRPTIGGIFAQDGITLLSEITDPAPGLVKTVTISYSGCGRDGRIAAAEYEVITL